MALQTPVFNASYITTGRWPNNTLLQAGIAGLTVLIIVIENKYIGQHYQLYFN
jgi:hypothetical protein